MTTVDAAATVDATAPVVPILFSLVAFIALYVWTAIALSAVFRKSGEEGWKAWVPVLNTIVLLQLGGLSGWLVLLAIVPIFGALALWVVQVIACYRINVSFGFGAGMTVLAALLFPVWATVVGFGSARWVGSEQSVGVRRTGAPLDERAADAGHPAPPPLPQHAPAAGPGWAASPAGSPAAPAPSTAASAAPHLPPLPASATAAAPATAAPPTAPDEPISFVPLASSPAAPPRPPLPTAAPDAYPTAPPSVAASEQRGWGGFELGAVGELTGEVTAAVKGAPQPIAAVPGGAEPADEASAHVPPVTRVPAARRAPAGEPWAPARSPLPEPDAFPEASGEVSAVVGRPDAGVPRSARSSVSAQHVLAEIPDDVEQTVIAHRRKAHWALVLPSGTPVELTGDVVLVGRRPAPSTAYPNAQLVEVDDGTVSKTHLRLERHGEEWSVTDLHSTNGTILIASDGSEREISPGAAHRAPGRFLIGDAEVRLTPADASR